ARRGLPHGILRHEVRPVLPGRVPRAAARFGDDGDALLRRLARACVPAAGGLVPAEDGGVPRRVPAAPRVAAAAALRPADGLCMEVPAAARAPQRARDRRRRARARPERCAMAEAREDKGWLAYQVDVLWSQLRTMAAVFAHGFRRRETILYPEEKPYLAPRFRGRIVLTRDPDGEERCVACYLCAAACPVDCIALE